MEWEESHVHVKFDYGEDVPSVLRRLADSIRNGRIEGTGVEQREDGEVWMVKDCGEYEILMPMDEDGRMVYDVYKRRAMMFDVRKK